MGTKTKPVKVRWSDLDLESVRPGVRRCGVAGNDAMLVMNELQPGMQVVPHSHDHDQIALVLEGQVRFDVEGERFDVGPGEVLVIPGGAMHSGAAIGDTMARNIDVFAPPRGDYAHLTAWMPGSDV